jgi:serine/threonine-protein kinase
VTFVERQIAHVWASSLAAIALTFVVEMLLGLPVLTLSPLLAISSGMVFLVKAGMLSGKFYVQALALFATAVVMAWLQRQGIRWGITLFGIVAAASFFLPGWKYHRQRVRAGQTVL